MPKWESQTKTAASSVHASLPSSATNIVRCLVSSKTAAALTMPVMFHLKWKMAVQDIEKRSSLNSGNPAPF